MANKRSITLHFDSEMAKLVLIDALLAARGIELRCENGELGDVEWAEVGIQRQRVSLTNCGNPGPDGRRRCLGHCALHPD